jgi:hypothetical protein
MTEADWLVSPDAAALLQQVRAAAGPRPRRRRSAPRARTAADPRKLRLFACACCRRWWPFLTEPWARTAVKVSERFADGLAREEERAAAERAAREVNGHVTNQDERRAEEDSLEGFPEWWANEAARPMHWASIWCVMNPAQENSVLSCEEQALEALAAGAAVPGGRPFALSVSSADLVREVFGNPFRPVPVDAAWLAWQDGTVARMARAIYAGRRFGDLPVLADALEDAGCADPALLGHLRAVGVHVPGCWALDLLLARP